MRSGSYFSFAPFPAVFGPQKPFVCAVGDYISVARMFQSGYYAALEEGAPFI